MVHRVGRPAFESSGAVTSVGGARDADRECLARYVCVRSPASAFNEDGSGRSEVEPEPQYGTAGSRRAHPADSLIFIALEILKPNKLRLEPRSTNRAVALLPPQSRSTTA